GLWRGYSSAGVPVHSTAFRAVSESSLEISPFRVFTSLLRLDLIDNQELRQFAEETLSKRQIFTSRVLKLIETHEIEGGLSTTDAEEFVIEALETFRWHSASTVSLSDYQKLNSQHRLIADVVAFKGPHINHLTPRTLDIDATQSGMRGKGITPKAVIEGPPRRRCPILLRQTSFKALDEPVSFVGGHRPERSSHSARFGEIEQRGAALTPKGRALYDKLLDTARKELGEFPNEENAERYTQILQRIFLAFPDTYREMRSQDLAYFRYFVTEKGIAARSNELPLKELDQLLTAGHVQFAPLVYEDFLPVSAAGIFQSNLGDDAQSHYQASSSQLSLERVLGCEIIDELRLYADVQRTSLLKCSDVLRIPPLV
ncbi:VOC family protein, partial [Pseudomonas syringae pv. theae]|nr:VOC family protein [Pseudomonas syringae pv. theae]